MHLHPAQMHLYLGSQLLPCDAQCLQLDSIRAEAHSTRYPCCCSHVIFLERLVFLLSCLLSLEMSLVPLVSSLVAPCRSTSTNDTAATLNRRHYLPTVLLFSSSSTILLPGHSLSQTCPLQQTRLPLFMVALLAFNILFQLSSRLEE